MGDYGSGRPRSYNKKATVEDCHVLTARALAPFMSYPSGTHLAMIWTQEDGEIPIQARVEGPEKLFGFPADIKV